MFELRKCNYLDNVELNTYLRQFFLSGNIISGSSSFSKSSLDIWKFLVHIMLNPSMQDFKHNLNSMGDAYNCPVVSTFFRLPFLGIGMRIDLVQSCGHCLVFQICWHIECSTLMASSLRVLNSSTGILSHTLALLTAVLPKAHLTFSRMSGSRWLTTPSLSSSSSGSFLYGSSMYFFLPFLISSAFAGVSTVCHLLCPSLGKMFPWYLQSQCLWTMVLEKTPESPLDSKEIKSVNLKGNQPWILVGRNDAKVETPVFWSSDAKSWLVGKVPDSGKDWRQK